jgi:hypothetical protein
MDQAGWVPLQNGHVGRDCNPKTVSIKVDFCWTKTSYQRGFSWIN